MTRGILSVTRMNYTGIRLVLLALFVICICSSASFAEKRLNKAATIYQRWQKYVTTENETDSKDSIRRVTIVMKDGTEVRGFVLEGTITEAKKDSSYWDKVKQAWRRKVAGTRIFIKGEDGSIEELYIDKGQYSQEKKPGFESDGTVTISDLLSGSGKGKKVVRTLSPEKQAFLARKGVKGIKSRGEGLFNLGTDDGLHIFRDPRTGKVVGKWEEDSEIAARWMQTMYEAGGNEYYGKAARYYDSLCKQANKEGMFYIGVALTIGCAFIILAWVCKRWKTR